MTTQQVLSKCIDTANKFITGSVSEDEMEKALKTMVVCFSCSHKCEFVDFLSSLPKTGQLRCPSCGWAAAGN